jgi:hypothetical protein
MLSYFSQRSCLFARRRFLMTPSLGAVAAALEVEPLEASVAVRCMQVAFTAAVDATMPGVLTRATR